MRSCAFKRLLASACALALVATQPSCASAHLYANATNASAPLLHDNVTFGATHASTLAKALTVGCALGRVMSPPAAAWADRHCPHPTLAAPAVAPGAALPAGAPTLPGVRQRLATEAGAAQTWLKQAADRTRDLAKQAPAAGAAWVLARHAQAGNGYAAAAAAVADAAAAALTQTRARLQRGLATAATAVNTAGTLVAAKTRLLAGAAATALDRARAAAADAAALLHGRCRRVTDATAAAHKHTRPSLQRGLPAAATAAAALLPLPAWPVPKVYPLHATAELLVGAAVTAGDAAAWAWPAAQAAAAQCRERALLAALRGRHQAMHAAGSLPSSAGLLVQWHGAVARCVLLLAVHGTVCAVACCCSQCCCLCVLLLLQTKHAV
jgi:hypothetical protein